MSGVTTTSGPPPVRDYRYGWADPSERGAGAERGLSDAVVKDISEHKQEPEWMLKNRLKALRLFAKKPLPSWGPDLSKLDFDAIKYFVTAGDGAVGSWEDLPADILATYDRLGIREAERQRLVAGVTAQYDSDAVYHQIREDLDAKGVIFTDTDTALKEHPELFKEFFGTVVPAGDNKFAALNTAAWSGGSFLYVPPGVHVDVPLQAYFRINTENMGQFERTLIVADEGSSVQYFEGCLLAGERITLAGGAAAAVEDVAQGDLVRDHSGTVSRVTRTMQRPYSGDVHTFKPISTGNAFAATSEHPILLVRRERVLQKRAARGAWKPEVSTKLLRATEPEWVSAKEVLPGDFLVFPKEPEGAHVTNLPPALGRLAGYYLAEGSSQVINKCKALTFSFHISESDYTDEVQSLCEELFGKRGSVALMPGKNERRVTVYTDEGYDVMSSNVGTRSWTKRLSPLFYQQGNDFIGGLIETYVNGDENFSTSGRSTQCRLATTSKEWAFQLQGLLTRQGIFATVRLERPGGPAEIMGREVVRHDLYKLVWTVGRTMGEVRSAQDHFLVPVKEISTQPYEGLVFNFETSPANSYLVKGFAVHNCSAPIYQSEALHSAVVEVVVKKDAHVRYTTIQNWSNDVYNLVTKRATVAAGGLMEWVDGNIGSGVTAKYPSVFLLGEGARGETLSLAMAGEGQHQDTGAKMIHAAPRTSSSIVSKSVSRAGGRTSYRGLVQVLPGAHHSASTVRCDALLLDSVSRSDTYPYNDIREDDVSMGHEATVSKVGEEQLFYLMSRGLPEDEAMAMVVRGFIEPVTRELPMEYALELNELIRMQMEGAVG
jgi:Fe-S cluster assembly protein SufB